MPYLMENGKWRAKRMIDGKVKTKSFATKREALKWEVEQTAESWQQTEQRQLTPSACFLEIMTDYLQNVKERFAKKTFDEKRLAIKSLFALLTADTLPEQITPALAAKALAKVARESSGHAANKARKNLAAAWEWAKKYHGIDSPNPFRDVEKFAADEKPRYVPPEDDFWKVYDVASQNDQVFLLFLLHTGARMSEAYRLEWQDIDFDRAQVRLGTRKTAHGGMHYAWIPLTSDLASALLAYKARCKNSGTVFVRENGEAFIGRQHLMGRLCARAGVRPFGFHAIRHLSATILAYAGLDIPTVQAMLRHQNPNTTARYIKSLGIQQDKIDAVFSKRKEARILSFEPHKKAIGT